MKELDWIEGWFQKKGWVPRDFQRDAWKAYLRGQDGLIHVSTGFGKTYAGCMAALAEMTLEQRPASGIHILYISPLRALSGDIIKSLKQPLEDMNLPFTVEGRTGDTTSAQRAKQKRNPPSILVTTPESFNLLLATEEYRQALKNCRLVVVDEWHELMGSKRGVQVQLCLSHLKVMAPKLRIWGLSATVGNPDLAGEVLNGNLKNFAFVTEKVSKEIDIQCLLPDEIDSFPWSGHLGLAMVEKVIAHIDLSHSCLLFTNVRSQTERWFNEIRLLKPEWENLMAIHHSSVDREKREDVEDKIKTGELKLVVCTSSLDLGVDFPMVERVYQIGSPKSISRFIQRAGRSGHTPTGVPRIYFVPTHALELFEYLATELAIERGLKEEITPPEMSFDVLAQHMVTLAANEGLVPEVAFREVKSTYAFRSLEQFHFDNLLLFLTQGGRSLSAYPSYHRLKEHDGRYLVHDKKMISQHLMNVGTITSDPSIRIKFMRGGSLGSVEESFVSKLRKGDRFVFAGKVLEYIMVKDLSLLVRLAPPNSAIIPIWWGSRLPLSSLLTGHLKEIFELIEEGRYDHPLVEYLSPIIEVQKALSRLPGRNYLLLEETMSREGKHLFIFPFEGRLVHEALAALLSVRLALKTKVTFSFSVSEYGLEILAPPDYDFKLEEMKECLSLDNLTVDIQKSLNMTQLAKKQFREIAQVSGLIQQNNMGQRRTMKNLQMSSSLLFDVFQTYEPEQPLYNQSFDEVRFFQFQEGRLVSVLRKLQQMPFEVYKTSRPSPLAFPLIVERIGSLVSTETLQDRLQRMKAKWTKA
ncbi:MAG TPA: ligase-associated DNA damage response DEXH box helicase [Bacteriovoracaceae bacterium]|nr:ligase-associated DNA damage response DEXH box helicase [Bacteriovoracaceae bacterium]